MTENLKKVNRLRNKYSLESIAEMMGISKNTLYKRMENDKWKKAETAILKTISE